MGELKSSWMRVSGLPFVRRVLDTLGMRVTPYYLYLEKREFADLSSLAVDFGDYDTGLLGPGDLSALAAMRGGRVTEAVYRQRLRKGALCCGMKHRGELVSFVWAETVAADALFGPFQLTPKEAYIFDAFTRPDYRGKALAPFLRRRIYAELGKKGRVDLYSYSLYTNSAAIRLKEKVKARVIGGGIHFRLFKRFHFDLQLRRGRAAGIFISGFMAP